MTNNNYLHLESLLLILVIIILLFPFRSIASDNNSETIRKYVKAERDAGRVPNLKTFGKEIRGRMSHLDLSDVDLTNTILIGGDFTECDLRRANLTNADITFAEFIRADMRNANLTGVDLDRCSFEHADMRGIIGFGSDNLGLGVKAQGVNLSGVDMQGANLRGVDLRDADLSNTDITNANLDEANLHGAIITNITCNEAFAINADMSDEQRNFLSERGAIAKGTDLEKRIANGVDYSDKDWMNIDISNLNLNGALLNNAILYHANLSGTQLQGAKLNGAKFSCTIFKGVTLNDSMMENCTIHGDRFEESKLCRVDFSGSSLVGCKFIDSDLSGANFSGADLRKAEFIRCDLSNTNFDGANVTYAVFENASGVNDDELAILTSRAKRWHVDVFKHFGKVLLPSYIALGICGFLMFIIAIICEIKNRIMNKCSA